MSATGRMAVGVVNLAVLLLPAGMRTRYREQWSADLRDASENGISPAEIASGSLSFAIKLDRPLARRAPGAEIVNRRSRLAIALALSTALLALTQYASVTSFLGLTGNGYYDYVKLTVSGLLYVYEVVAIVGAIILIVATRTMRARVRIGTLLLLAANLAGVAQVTIDSNYSAWDSVYLSPGNSAYLVALVLVVAAMAMSWPEIGSAIVRPANKSVGRPLTRHLLVSGICGLAMLAALAASVTYASLVWASRVPLLFSNPDDPARRAAYLQWVTLKALGEQKVLDVFVVWVIVGAIVAFLVFASGFGRSVTARGTIALTALGLCLLMISNGAIQIFLQIMWIGYVPSPIPSEVMTLLGRWGIVVIVLYVVGGVSLRARNLPSAEESRIVTSASASN